MSNKLSLIVNFLGVDKMSGALRNIVGLGNKGSKSIRALTGESKKLERELAKVRRQLSSGAGNVTELVNSERALERQIASTNQQMERQKRLLAINADKQAMLNRAQDLKSKGTENILKGVAMAAPLILATKAAADFSSGMVDIQQKAELSDQAADRLAGRIIMMSNAAKQMPEAMRSGLDALLAKGMTLDTASAALPSIGRLATAYKVEIPDAANATFAALSNLKIAAADTNRVLDTMAAAGNAGGFEMADMARAFPSLTAQMQALGEKGVPAVADLSAALQVAMHTAGSADEAGTNIQNLLGKINAPDTINAFKKNFGIDLPAAMKKLTDEGYSSLEAITLITQKATKGDTKKLGFAFGDQQARMGMLALIQNLDEYRTIRAAAMKSDGTVDKAFGQRATRDATVQWRAFMGTASGTAIVLGTTLLPIMTQVLGSVSAMASAFANWAQANPELSGALMQGAAALVTLRIGLGAAQLAFGGLLGPVAKVLPYFRKVDGISKFGSHLSTLGNAATRAKGLVTVAFTGIKTGSAVLKTAGSNALAAGARFVVAGAQYAVMAAKFVIGKAAALGGVLLSVGRGALTMGMNFLRAGIMMMANPVVLIITLIVAAVAAAAYLIYSNWDKISAAFSTGVNAVKGYLQGLPDWLKNIGSMMMQGLLMAINPMALASKLLDVARNGMTAFKNYFGIKSPSRLFMAMGGHLTAGLERGIDQTRRGPVRAIGRMATGVAAAGAMSLTPMQAAAKPVSAGGGATAAAGSIEIHVHGSPGMSVDDLADAVIRKLERVQAKRGRGRYEER